MIYYMDCAATTKLSDVAALAFKNTASEFYFNPSSHHDGGYKAKQFLNANRLAIAELVGAHKEEIYFTSGGSESNNWALEVIAREGLRKGKKHIISSQIEHHSVLNKLKELKSRGFEVTLIKPRPDGIVDAADVISAIRPETCGISLMAVNNELGTVQPIFKVGQVCQEKKIFFHVDAVQGMPHLIWDLQKFPINYLSASGHKFEGPRGCGFLYVKSGSPLSPLIYGGAQEFGMRAGTENLPAIAAMKVALAQRVGILKRMDKDYFDFERGLKRQLINGLRSIGGCHIHMNSDDESIPTIVNFYFDDVLGETLLSLLNSDGVYCSAGSACAAGDPEPSHVLKAIGYSDNAAKNSIRLSFDWRTSSDDIGSVIEIVRRNVNFVRGV